MASEPYIRYVVRSHFGFLQWRVWAARLLAPRGWRAVDPRFLDPRTMAFPMDPEDIAGGGVVVFECQGRTQYDAVLGPQPGGTVVDDLLTYLSLYTGVYCHYLWKEVWEAGSRPRGSEGAALKVQRPRVLLARRADALPESFERALSCAGGVGRERLALALRWFNSAQIEGAAGRLDQEAAMGWLALETQANCTGLHGSRFARVSALLVAQGFPRVPALRDLYRLRTDAFRDGPIYEMPPERAEAARSAGKALVRAQLLNLLGMQHGEFDAEFVRQYA